MNVKEKIDNAIIDASNGDFSSFNNNIKEILTNKLENLTQLVVDEKTKTVFQK